MIKLEHVVLPSPEQMEFIIEGMRNPLDSWEKSDSVFGVDTTYGCSANCGTCKDYKDCEFIKIGPNDLGLMQRLANAGTDHRKFMRMMPVYVRITAPLYWWKEFDTYKVGTVSNSCSTMHKIHAYEFTTDDFSDDHLILGDGTGIHMLDCDKEDGTVSPWLLLEYTVQHLNKYRKLYLETKDKKYWWQMIQLLPSSYNQTRNVMLNYEVLANIYKSRKGHKLDEWRVFCEWIEGLSYSELITLKTQNMSK